MRLIIAEDDLGVRERLSERLRDEGIEVEGVGTALEFYRSLSLSRFDIAIIDIHLSDENGLAIASRLSKRHRIGIIVMTPSGDLADRLAIRRSGADIYLLKPVDGDELIQGVRNLARRILAVEPGLAEFSANDWFFDPVHWTLQPAWGEAVRLSAKRGEIHPEAAA